MLRRLRKQPWRCPEARALLADRLVERLDPAEDGYLHRLWAAEAQRRLEELRSGTVQAIPGHEAVVQLRKNTVDNLRVPSRSPG
jgi:hypothetical protein